MSKISSMVKFERKPKFAVRHKRRCLICGRPKATYRKFKMCRLCLRELALRGEIPGLVKASW
ncbi:MAG: 30S ribosomal protein S14 type Z [Candidatus Aminicenantes bacterium RBG_13_62_12]|nr:MAG: 30S ribosomal protein S14 type Z [Candidatus Aminicenantes bacterium RBG_13_62_12]